MDRIGVMPIPPDFKYLDVYHKGRPAHERYDSFSVRHPRMAPGKRAKLFAPFDALRGFHFAILTKEVPYVDKPELSCEEARALNSRLARLRELTRNSRAARQNCVFLTVSYFQPCGDPENEAYGKRGQIHSLSGICRWVDWDLTRTIRIGEQDIPCDSILRIESDEA